MSSDYRIYLGPYAVCQVAQVQTDVAERSCLNGYCSRYTTKLHDPDTAFCPKCGSPVTARTRTVTQDGVDEDELRDRIKERLVPLPGNNFPYWRRQTGSNVHVWIGNLKSQGREHHLDAKGDFLRQDITPELMAEEAAAFLVSYAGALATLQDAYGNLTVKWGLLRYDS